MLKHLRVFYYLYLQLDLVHSQNTTTSMMPNMETSVLLHNIQRIVQVHSLIFHEFNFFSVNF